MESQPLGSQLEIVEYYIKSRDSQAKLERSVKGAALIRLVQVQQFHLVLEIDNRKWQLGSFQ